MHSVYIHLNYFNKLPQKNEDDNQGSRAAESNSNRNVFFLFQTVVWEVRRQSRHNNEVDGHYSIKKKAIPFC